MRTETITKTIFKFNELSDSAKETARDWFRSCIDHDDFDTVIEDAVNMGKLLGIEIDSKGQSHCVYWSGFSSQGDGACFEGSYAYKKGSVKAILSETGAKREDASKGDKELLRIAKSLQAIQKTAFYQLTATMKHSGHYNHSGCMSVDVSRYDDKETTCEQDEAIRDLMRDFANWIYKQLDAENDYLYSEENVDESIEANDYEFYEDGEKA